MRGWRLWLIAVSLLVIAAILLRGESSSAAAAQVRKLLRASTGTVRLPAGVIEVASEIRLPDGAHDLDISGAGTTLRIASRFRGRALISCRGCRNVHLRDFSIDGNGQNLQRARGLPNSGQTFAETFDCNGLLFDGGQGLRVSGVSMRNMPAFALLVSAARHVTLERIHVEQSGGSNALGRNNSSGGILLEEGVTGWRVADCVFREIAGNAVWTHSRYGSPRAAHGTISGNSFETIGRDAIQVGHATDVEVRDNRGSKIGWPIAAVDSEARAVPVAIDTAGDVDASTYEHNHFEEVDGKCIDLDGFHDGVVRDNECISRGLAADYPWGQYGIVMNNSAVGMQSRNILIEGNRISGMKYGGIFIIGEGHRVIGNRLQRLNLAHCAANVPACAVAGQPGLLSAGIYLGDGGAKPAPAQKNQVTGNIVTGFGMRAHCVEYGAYVDAKKNTVKDNHCADE